MSEVFLTRRQAREQERLQQSQNLNADDAQVFNFSPEPVQPEIKPEPEVFLSRRELRDRERGIQERLEAAQKPQQPLAVEIPEELISEELVIENVEPAVELSTNFIESETFFDDANPGTIPTQIIKREISTETNSIVLPTLPELTGNSFVVPASNIVIHTGTIDLAGIAQEPATHSGEITLVTQPFSNPETFMDDLLGVEAGMQGILGIEPVAAREISKRSRERIFPGRLRKGWGALYMVLGVALLMSALGSLVFFIYTSKLI